MSKTKKGKTKMPKASSSKRASTKKKSKLPSMFSQRYGKLAIFVAIFAFIGLVTLLYSMAAIPTGTIKSKASNNCLENFYNRQLDGNFISTYPCQSGNKAQQWSVYSTDKSIRTAQNFCLDVQKGGTTPMTKVHLWRCTGGAPQKWDILSTGQLRNPNSMLCLEAGATNTFLGGPNMYVNTCNSNNSRQLWSVPSVTVPLPTPTPTNPPAPTTPTGAVDVKAACKNTTVTANGTTVRPQYANDASTGPEVGGLNEDKLLSSGRSGKWSITQDGYVINGVYHNGVIEVNANNVIIKNSVICGAGTMIVRNNGQNLTIENSIIRGERGVSINANTGEPCAAGVGYGNYTMRRTEIVGCADGAKLANKVAIYNSFFHDNFRKEGVTHTDIIQKNDLTLLNSFVYEGNASYGKTCTSNRHFQIEGRADQPAMSLLRIKGNFFYGLKGINFLDMKTTSGEFSGNVFAGSATQGPMSPPLYAGGGAGLNISGNRYESGQPADSNYAFSYKCTDG